MLRIDVSKAISPRLGIYLFGIIPGVFFESSTALGNPNFAASAISRVREIYPFGPYALVALFFLSAMLIGEGFMRAAWLADRIVSYLYTASRWTIRKTLSSQWFYHALIRWQGNSPKQSMTIRWLWKARIWGCQNEFAAKARPIVGSLLIASRNLLKVRYGITRNFGGGPEAQAEWKVWPWILGKPLKGLQEAALASRVFLGCGIAGLTALYATPALRNRYFVFLSSLFALAGFLVTVDLARCRIVPGRRSWIQLQSVLLELSQVGTGTDQRLDSDPSSQTSGAAATDE